MEKKSQLFCILSLVSFTSFANPLTLKEAYEKAIIFNQSNEISQSRVDQAQALYEKNRGTVFPKIAFKGTYTFLDQLTDQKTMALNLSQSLYKGGRDGLVLDYQEKNIETQNINKVVALQTLLKEVVDSYYAHWQNSADVNNLLLLKDQSEKRRNEIRERVRIGRSRRGELLQAESQLATVEANLLNANGLMRESAKKLSALIGASEQNWQMPEMVEDVKKFENLESYLKLAESRAELQVKRTYYEMTDLEVKSNKRAHLPTLDLASNYYLNKRSGSLRNSDWDLSLTVSVPLFEGGSTEASVRESVAKKMQAYYEANDQQRKIESEVKTKYEAAVKFAEQLKAGERAFNLAKENYNETLKDYRLGLVTNLDTLSALNTYLDAKRSYDRTKIQAKSSLEQLNVAVGTRP